jgi:hypothetical protein
MTRLADLNEARHHFAEGPEAELNGLFDHLVSASNQRC